MCSLFCNVTANSSKSDVAGFTTHVKTCLATNQILRFRLLQCAWKPTSDWMKESGSDVSATKQVCLDPVKRATHLYSETCIRQTPTVPSLVSVSKRCPLNTGSFYSRYWKKWAFRLLSTGCPLNTGFTLSVARQVWFYGGWQLACLAWRFCRAHYCSFTTPSLACLRARPKPPSYAG